MLVTYKHKENKKRNSKDDLILEVEFDNNIRIIKKLENYDYINYDTVKDYCSIFEKDKSLSIDEYKMNIDIVNEIYRESITKHNLLKIIKMFPKQNNGCFKKGKQIIIARCINAKYDKNTKFYTSNCIVAVSKTSKTLALEYKSVSFI